MTTLTVEDDSELLDFLEAYDAKHGYMPSVREIMAERGLSSTSVVSGRLRRLESRGLIRRSEGKSRAYSLRVVKLSSNASRAEQRAAEINSQWPDCHAVAVMDGEGGGEECIVVRFTGEI